MEKLKDYTFNQVQEVTLLNENKKPIGKYKLWSNRVKLYTIDNVLALDKQGDYFASYFMVSKRLYLENYLVSYLENFLK